METLAQKIVKELLSNLMNRQGLEDEWNAISEDVKNEIKGTLEEIVDNILNEEKKEEVPVEEVPAEESVVTEEVKEENEGNEQFGEKEEEVKKEPPVEDTPKEEEPPAEEVTS